MMKTYPLFFREKVVNALTLGMNKSAACKAFAISRSTLDDWLGFKASTGTLETPKGKKVGKKPLISDEELPQLKILIDENRPNTLQDIRALWPQPVSLSTISRAVIRLNYSVKKRQFLTLKEMKDNGSYI